MGRNFPVGETIAVNHYPFISISIFIACMAATIAIISSLCGSLSRKKSEESSSDTKEIQENKDGNTSSAEGAQNENASSTKPLAAAESGSTTEMTKQQNDEDGVQQPLPPPPGRRHLSATASCHFRSSSALSASSSSSHTKLPASRSMRVFGSGLASRQASKREDNERKKDKKLKHEDSIWKKTIILGEKCKVPEEEEDTILYDEKGNRISTYHPKPAKPLSRQGSNIDQDSVPR